MTITLNDDIRSVTVNKQPVHLTPSEYEILAMLLERKGRCVTREMIFKQLYGDRADADESAQKIVDVFVCKVRKKLTAIDQTIKIRPLYGRGYVLDEAV